ncbi:MAG: metal-sensitive transcriptional regulator [Longimicrobiales bacterium]|nr:metal-sensitive transcriptional regulator [Longimicrobiales bacterium]
MARAKEAVPHAVGIPDDVRQDLVRRLSRIRGQVDGLVRMVEEDRYCPDVLQQFAAVRSALRSAEKVMLGSHLEGCASRALSDGGRGAEQVREEILDLFSRYMK